MSKQIALSIEQMKHLEELGLNTSDASMYWELKGNDDNSTYYNLEILDFDMDMLEKTDIPTYTLQDILYKLPKNKIIWIEIEIYYSEINLIESVDDEPFVNIIHCVNGKDLLNDAYDMLCWCIENGYIKKQ